jgi:uncharacterized protein YeaO (DUF488 family)
MILIRHLMDGIEADGGDRLWVEPIGLTSDLQQWCSVDQLISDLAPDRALWDWFQEHPDGYEYFRGKYHESLDRGLTRHLALELARACTQRNFTLLHQSDDPEQNTATALYEFLVELQAYCPPDV